MRFEKLTFEEALLQTRAILGGDPAEVSAMRKSLEKLEMPRRATKGSAGYDFRSPWDICIKKGKSKAIPLFVKIEDMPSDVVLLLFNRSGLSLRKGLRLDNSVGVIDSDYKQGIVFQATATKDDVLIKQGDRICQGIFVHRLLVEGDDGNGEERVGGFGSTGK